MKPKKKKNLLYYGYIFEVIIEFESNDITKQYFEDNECFIRINRDFYFIGNFLYNDEIFVGKIMNEKKNIGYFKFNITETENRLRYLR